MVPNRPDKVQEGWTNKRRQFIKAVGTSVGLGAITNTVSARKPIDALAEKSLPKAKPTASRRDGGQEIANQPDTYDGGSVIGKQNMTIYRWKGTPSAGGFLVPVDQESSMTTYYSDSKNLLDNVDHTTIEMSWNTDGPGTVAKTDPKERNTGMHPSSGDGDYTWTDAAIETGHNNFLDIIAAELLSPIYTPAELVGKMVSNWYDHNQTTESITREFSYTYEEVGSNWSEYLVTIDPDASFDLTFANVTSIRGMGSLVSFLTVSVSGSSTASLSPQSISTMSATEAEQKDIDVYKLDTVKKNPHAFGVTESFLKDYDHDYLYKVPVEIEVKDKGTTVPDGFIKRNRNTVEEHYPDLL